MHNNIKDNICICFYLLSGSFIPYVGLMANAGNDVTLLRPWSCGKNICPPGFTGQVCEVEIGTQCLFFTFQNIIIIHHRFLFS